uniref:Transposase n=1 Tax=Ascaris lumbricoides TaxID=6252 RepID=A0A0M3HZN4_ASCLU
MLNSEATVRRNTTQVHSQISGSETTVDVQCGTKRPADALQTAMRQLQRAAYAFNQTILIIDYQSIISIR